MTDTRSIFAITIGSRHRGDMGDVPSLAGSIAEICLLHPVVLRPDGQLIAGARRLAAAASLGRDTVLVTVIDMASMVRDEFAGISVWLVIGETSSGIILSQSAIKLGTPRIYEGEKMDHGGMVFWPRRRFDRWGFSVINPGQMHLLKVPHGRRFGLQYAPGHLP